MTFIPDEENSKSAFDSLLTTELTPIIQEMAINGISDKMVQFNFGTGSGTTSADSAFICNSGTDVNGFGVITTDETLRCSSGQGALVRISAVFNTPVTGYEQLVGPFIAGDGLAFASRDLNFGIQHSRNGKNEIQELQITSATTTAGDLTITINSVAFTVPVTVATVEANAVEIAESLESQVTIYTFTANEDTVVIRSSLTAAQGTFSFALDTAVGTAGTFTQISVGTAGIATFINQTSWNVDVMDGTGPSGQTLDITKGNLYQIQLECLGYVTNNFYIENGSTGVFQLVHKILNANVNTSPTLGDPNMRVGWSAGSIGGSGTDITLKGTDVGVFIEGRKIQLGGARGAEDTKLSVGTTFTNILTLRNRQVRGDRRNRSTTSLLQVSGLTDSTKGAIVRVVKNATVAGPVNFKYIDKIISTTEVDIDGTDVTGGELLAVLTIGAEGSAFIDLEKFGLRMPAESSITLSAAVVSNPASDITASIDFRENA